jgi:catechol 2,3-dioxygenase-like lactoylglutathione lyase family enzyme
MTAPFHSSRDVILRTKKMAEAAQFYETTLGLKPTMQREGMLGFETGAFQLFVEDGAPAHGPVFDMWVPSLEAAKEKLLAAGCTIQEEDPSIPRCYVRDPFGLVFNIEQR